MNSVYSVTKQACDRAVVDPQSAVTVLRMPPVLSAYGIGWHYSSNATCIIRPHVFSTALIV